MKAPTPEQVDRAIAHLGKPGANAYFFNKLRNPLWIAPLASRGFFKRPPELQRHPSDGTISFPDWPELRFLLSVSHEAPDTVGKVATEIPDTNNLRVQQILVEVGANLNADYSRQIGKRAIQWLENDMLRSHFGEPFPILISHLARQGEQEIAIKLARRFFRVGSEAELPRRDIDAWHQERYFGACLPSLLKHAGIRAIELLRDLLLDAVGRPTRDSIDDYSYIWRKDILKANFSVKEPRDVLIDALRDSSVELASQPAIGSEQVCRLLLAAGRPLLTRIALFVAAKTGKPSDPVVLELLCDLSLVDRSTCHDEYVMLLRAMYSQLSPDSRAKVESLVVSDPLQSISEGARRQMDPMKLERVSKQVLRDRLLAFGPDLPDGLQKTLAKLLDEVGDPPEPIPLTGTWGPSSPATEEDLQSMSVQEIAAYAKSWVSPNGIGSPQPEGLGRAIGGQVRDRLDEFSEQAQAWVGQDPTYVRWVLMAIGDAVRNKASVNSWTSVLVLINWVIEQTDSEPASAGDQWAERDTSWRWTRQSIARLIEAALQQRNSQLSFEHRSEVWKILSRLLVDVDPPVIDNGREDEDLFGISFNSIRGIATHALMQYIWWVHRNTDRAQPFSFNIMDEARIALESALKDAHPAIVSPMGQWFRQLFFLDVQWTREHIEEIFPASNDRILFWRASWYAFVQYSPPYDPAFELLRPKYELALNRMTAAPEESPRSDGERGLGEHLASYFWRQVGGDITREFLLKYFDTCSPQAAAHIAFFLGRGLADEKHVPAHTVEALMALWEELRRRSLGWNEQKRRELARQFGQWFGSGHLPSDWRLRELETALNYGVGLFDTESAFAQLSTLVGSYPQQVARCLKLLLVDQQESWHLSVSRSESTNALAALLASSDEVARAQGLTIVNQLVEAGNLAVRDIARRTNS